MHAVTVPLNALRAVALFAGNQDIRYYLNGVLVTSFRDKLTLAATDGHRLTVFHDVEIAYAGPEFIIPNHVISGFKPDRIFSDVEISFDNETGQVTLGAGGATITGKAVDGVFPDWQRVIPRKPSGRFSSKAANGGENYHGANADYLATYAKMHKLLGSRFPAVTFAPNGSSSVLVDIGDSRFVCVLMPMHTSAPKLPEWFTASHKAPKAPKAVDTHMTGDGKKFTTLQAATDHAGNIHRETGIITSIVEIKPEAVSA